jgi:hypothetical protein
MKTRYISLIILVSFLTLQYGCGVSTRGELPYGMWQSEEPYILLDIVRDNPILTYSGKHERDGEIVDILISFAVSHKAFNIYLFDNQKEVGDLQREIWYFYGDYKFKEDGLIYTLSSRFREEHGIRSITFTKIQDYDPLEEDN